MNASMSRSVGPKNAQHSRHALCAVGHSCVPLRLASHSCFMVLWLSKKSSLSQPNLRSLYSIRGLGKGSKVPVEHCNVFRAPCFLIWYIRVSDVFIKASTGFIHKSHSGAAVVYTSVTQRGDGVCHSSSAVACLVRSCFCALGLSTPAPRAGPPLSRRRATP